MPEYLSPGVYIEETSFRSKTIEGVSTSTAGFVGPTRYGPVSGAPVLVTSLAEYQRIFGDLEDLNFTDQANTQVGYLGHAARAFFEEGDRGGSLCSESSTRHAPPVLTFRTESRATITRSPTRSPPRLPATCWLPPLTS